MTKKLKRIRTKVINDDVYCIKCNRFLGTTCDPFRKNYCEECFSEDVPKDKSK